MGHHIIADNQQSVGIPPLSNPTRGEVFSSCDRIPVPSATLDGLRRCISNGEGRIAREDIRDAVSPICNDARQTQAMPEQLLVTLKELCHSLPEYGRIKDAQKKGAFMDAVVSVAIEEYYRK